MKAARLLVLAWTAAWLSAVALAADWPMSACNPQRTYRTEEDIRAPFQLAWVRYFNDAYVPHRVEPIVAGGTVYVSSSKGVYALDAANGQEKWLFATALPVGHAPSVAGGLVFVPGLDKQLHALDAASGQRKWAFQAGAGFFGNPLIVNGTVYVGCLDGNVYALAAADGQRRWTFSTGGPIYFSPAFDDGKIYIGSNDMHGYAIDAATGKLIWKTDKLPGKSMNSFWPVVARKAGAVIFVMDNAYRAQHLATLDHEVKAKTWHWQGQGGFRGGIYTDQQLRDLERITIEYFQQHPHRQTFLIIDPATGRQKQFAPVLMVGNAGTRMPPAIGPDGLCYMTIHHDHNSGGLLGGCHAVSYDIEKNRFVRCYSYHSLGGCSLVGDEPHGLSMAGNMFYGQHHYDTAGGVDINSASASTISGHGGILQTWHKTHKDVKGQDFCFPFMYQNPHNTISSMTFSEGRVFILTKQTNALFVFQGQRSGK